MTNKLMPLDKSQIKKLKSLVHHLHPIILLGAKGLTDQVHKEIAQALFDHELIKIKLNSKDKSEKAVLTKAICEKHNATLITQIGHLIAIYAPSDKSEKSVLSQ